MVTKGIYFQTENIPGFTDSPWHCEPRYLQTGDITVYHGAIYMESDWIGTLYFNAAISNNRNGTDYVS